MPLTGQQVRHLRGLGHHLDPVVLIGKNGLTDAVLAQLTEAIVRHELIKVKLQPECPIDRHEAGDAIAGALGAELVQVLGKTILFFKRNPQAARVELPKASAKKAAKAAKAAKAPAPAPRPAPRDDDGDVIDEDDDEDDFADFEEDEAPKAKRPHPRVIEDRAPVKRAAPAKKAAPKRAATVRRGANRGEVIAEKPSRDDKPKRDGDKPAKKSDRPYNREKGARPAEKRPYNRDRSTPEARERRPFSRATGGPAKRSSAPKPSGPRRGPR